MDNKKKMEIIRIGEKNDIAIFESQLDFSLPNDYKDFLSKYDGVRFYNCEFEVKDIKQKVLMDILYGIKGVKRYDIYKNNEHFADEIPNRSLVIGEDPGGTPILLINDEKIKGIYFFDSNYFFEQSSDDENTYIIANTFTDFINMLNVEEVIFREE